METALSDLWYGFGVALEPQNLMYCFLGVLIGNMVGVLPGMGPLATISILLPLTFGIKPVGAILMLAGIFYGSQYGGAICSILLNLPCHPPHAVTCLDGFPMTRRGKGGVALGITVIGSFIGASWGITEMMFLAPVLVNIALKFGPAEICSLMLLGLLAGSTLARGSPLKGVAMTVLGLIFGLVGSDLETGAERLTFGFPELDDGIELVALALGLFGIAEFMNSVNQASPINTAYSHVKLKDMRPSWAELKWSFPAMIRGTIVGSLCSLIPGTGPTIASFVAYATEKKVAEESAGFRLRRNPGRGGPRSRHALLGAGRLHPHHESRHPRRRGHGAPARRTDDPGHRARSAAHQRAPGYLLGPHRELLDRQHHAGDAQRAAH